MSLPAWVKTPLSGVMKPIRIGSPAGAADAGATLVVKVRVASTIARCRSMMACLPETVSAFDGISVEVDARRHGRRPDARVALERTGSRPVPRQAASSSRTLVTWPKNVSMLASAASYCALS